MATKKAILQAYYLISANAKLVDEGNDEKFKILIRSWEIAFRNIDDNQLGYAVERFLTEVTEVNRSMVVSAKLLELCQPKERPFNENIVPSVIGQLILNWRDENKLIQIKAETDPLLWKIIVDYPFSVIKEASNEQLPTIYAQIRNDYRTRYLTLKAEEHNKKLEQLKLKNDNILRLEDK